MDVSVSPENIHMDTSEVQNRRKMNDEQRAAQAFRYSIADSMQSMSYTALLQELHATKSSAIDMKEKELKLHDDRAINFYRSTYQQTQERVGMIMEELERIKKARME
jgi:hypothetical protein